MENNYTFIEKFLHFLYLSNNSKNIRIFLFNIEKFFFRERVNKLSYKMKPVFVLGFARSGTTIIAESLYKTENFASLNYNHMPFIMAPNIWSFISRIHKKIITPSQRAHKDNIFIDNNSIESFEEVFWNTFQKKFKKKNFLAAHTFNKTTYDYYNIFQSLVCIACNKNRYLSKNNNNILRLKSLLDKSDDLSIFIIPFRDPVDQSISLLNQHRNFTQSTNFESTYMSWLNHHEFGSGHKPFKFSTSIESKFNQDNINYWIHQWNQYYLEVLKIISKSKKSIYLIPYNSLCTNKFVWQNLCNQIEINNKVNIKFRFKTYKKPNGVNKSLQNLSSRIYKELLNHKFTIK